MYVVVEAKALERQNGKSESRIHHTKEGNGMVEWITGNLHGAGI